MHISNPVDVVSCAPLTRNLFVYGREERGRSLSCSTTQRDGEDHLLLIPTRGATRLKELRSSSALQISTLALSSGQHRSTSKESRQKEQRNMFAQPPQSVGKICPRS